MNEVDKKSITPAYEYRVDGYRYQLMREIAIANNSAVDNLVGALTSLTISDSNMFSLITTLEDEVREREAKIADLTSENKALNEEKEALKKEIDILKSKVELSGSVAEDIKKLNDSLDFKDKWIKALKEENKSLVLLRNQLSTQLFSANVEIEALKQKINDLEAEKSGENKEDVE